MESIDLLAIHKVHEEKELGDSRQAEFALDVHDRFADLLFFFGGEIVNVSLYSKGYVRIILKLLKICREQCPGVLALCPFEYGIELIPELKLVVFNDIWLNCLRVYARIYCFWNYMDRTCDAGVAYCIYIRLAARPYFIHEAAIAREVFG